MSTKEETMTKAIITPLFFLCSLLLGLGTQSGRDEISKVNLNTPIRVLLDKGSQELSIKSVAHDMYGKDDGAGGWIKFSKAVSIKLSKDKTSIIINDIPFPSKAVYLRGGPHPMDKLQYKTDLYRGALKVAFIEKGLLVTNVLPLEDYLQGMLGGEMSPTWEMEALKAQSVASRTYALYMIHHPKSSYYDLEKGTGDQVYNGANAESERARKAVDATRGQYLTMKSQPIKSYFHSRCGGLTETAKTVWKFNEKGNQSRVPCTFCQKFPYVWKSAVKARDLLSFLKLPFAEASPFKVTVAERSPSGRVGSVKIQSGGQEKLINSDELRSLLGYTKVKSTRFDWKIQGRDIEFEGVGSGHGVGMCQWGARFLAQSGKNYRQILSHYYPSAEFNWKSKP